MDLFVERYGARAYGPDLFFAGDAPKTELDWIGEGSELPGGLVALYDGRGRNETPMWLPEQRAIVFADALTERDGQLVVWGTPWHEKRVLPALRELLDLPFEHVIISHGEPVHDRAAFERALELPPYMGEIEGISPARRIALGVAGRTRRALVAPDERREPVVRRVEVQEPNRLLDSKDPVFDMG